MMQKYDSYKDSGVQWLGEIPSHWDMLALKHILKLRKKLVGKQSYKYDLLSLTLQGIIKRDMDNPTGKFPSSFDTYQEVNAGDFVFCNFDNEETPRAVGLSEYRGMITGAYDVLSCKNSNLTNRYLIYYFLYIDDAKRFKPLYKGLRKTVPFDSFMSYKIPVPPIEEQQAIAAYLDEQTAKIDTAIAQQQKMIDLLNERKQIIINHAVTKGLNPNVKMKDSGVEWIGEVPEGWEIKKMKFICTVNDEVLPESSGDFKIKYIEIGDVDFNNGIMGSSEYSFKEAPSRARRITRKGDVIISTVRTYLKAIAKIEEDGYIVSTGFAVLRGHNIMSDFLAYSLMTDSFVMRVLANSVGVSYPAITAADLMNLEIAIPPIKTQGEIIYYLQKNTQDINSAIKTAEQQIALLQERKQIIINDVVTGKVKVC
ncbi:MAG: restriction endonuclease subunit S [Bacteroidaceae bacterium]|nr:restriction endonuclease subunit S [Bacteroidaceae bacterium]